MHVQVIHVTCVRTLFTDKTTCCSGVEGRQVVFGNGVRRRRRSLPLTRRDGQWIKKQNKFHGFEKSRAFENENGFRDINYNNIIITSPNVVIRQQRAHDFILMFRELHQSLNWRTGLLEPGGVVFEHNTIHHATFTEPWNNTSIRLRSRGRRPKIILHYFSTNQSRASAYTILFYDENV